MNPTKEAVIDYIKTYPKKHTLGYSNYEITCICKHFHFRTNRLFDKLLAYPCTVMSNGDLIHYEDDVIQAFTGLL